MSEKTSNIINTELPEDLEHFENLDMMTYANGAKHVYGMDESGKRTHISHDDVLKAYGYASREEETTPDDPLDPVAPPFDVLDPVPPAPENFGEDEEAEPIPGPSEEPIERLLGRMQANLAYAEQDYAKTTAKARKSYLGRFCQGKTRIGRTILKLPGAGNIVKNVNEHLDTKTLEAKQEYDQLYNEVGIIVAEYLREQGYTEEQIISISASGAILRGSRLNHMILAERKNQSKDTNKFVNWWVRSGGLKGKLSKVGIVAGAGVIAGATAGLALPVYASFLAGGAAGGGIARHVTRRRANAVDSDGRTLASKQAGEDQRKIHQFAYENFENNEFSRVEDITDRVEYRTDDEMLGNRRRMKAAVAIGKMAGGFAGIGVKELLYNKPETPKDMSPDAPRAEAPKVPDADPGLEAPDPVPETPEINGRMFNVESGNGFTHEIQDFANANGTQVDAKRAFDIYNEAVAKFGEDGLIDPLGTYKRPQGDYGIMSPGNAQWKPGVAEFFKSKLQ